MFEQQIKAEPMAFYSTCPPPPPQMVQPLSAQQRTDNAEPTAVSIFFYLFQTVRMTFEFFGTNLALKMFALWSYFN